MLINKQIEKSLTLGKISSSNDPLLKMFCIYGSRLTQNMLYDG